MMSLSFLPGTYAVCSLDPQGMVPEWALRADFLSITRTPEELSVVCAEADVPDGVRCSRGWRCLKVEGPLDLALTGVLASLAGPLAEAGIGVFAVSTYDTDYLLIREKDAMRAASVLAQAGHIFWQPPQPIVPPLPPS